MTDCNCRNRHMAWLMGSALMIPPAEGPDVIKGLMIAVAIVADGGPEHFPNPRTALERGAWLTAQTMALTEDY